MTVKLRRRPAAPAKSPRTRAPIVKLPPARNFVADRFQRSGELGSPKKTLKSKKLEKAFELAKSLASFRKNMDEVIDYFKLRIDSDLVQVIQILEEAVREEEKDLKNLLPSAKNLEILLKKVAKFRVKPLKGRLKDLSRAQKLIDFLLNSLD